MQIVKTIEELQNIRKNLNGNIGFVPTMGALHDGHISLIRKAKDENEVVIVSIFVNPTQFLKGEDLNKYPRKEEADIKICQMCKVDYLFIHFINAEVNASARFFYYYKLGIIFADIFRLTVAPMPICAQKFCASNRVSLNI